MSAPTAGPTIAIQLDTVEALAAELAALSAELADDAALCRSAARSLYAALDGDAGLSAGSAATAWASLTDVVAARSGAVAGTLVGAASAYRIAEARRASRIAAETPGARRGGP
ncbi:MAG: hypothetical protein JWQ45_2942 [Blastococcus sp.]|jgi:hypothetical protein|nr:hypothetical protein [Blastococcus sp.]